MKRISALLLVAAIAAPACSSEQGDDGMGSGSGSGSGSSGDEWDQLLGQRVVDYNAALRVAALRLTGKLPTMDEINQVANGADDAAKKVAYEGLIQQYMNTPDFIKAAMVRAIALPSPLPPPVTRSRWARRRCSTRHRRSLLVLP